MDLWHERHNLAHKPTSLDILGQTNLDEINLLDALTPGGDNHVADQKACDVVEEELEDKENQLKYHIEFLLNSEDEQSLKEMGLISFPAQTNRRTGTQINLKHPVCVKLGPRQM